MKYILIALIFIFISDTAIAANDPLAGVFDKIDDLVIRIDSGVNLNSFAETLAEIKIDVKRALNNPERITNPLLDDRFKKTMAILDDLSRAWKFQETDRYSAVNVTAETRSKYHEMDSCRKIEGKFEYYPLPCVKSVLMDYLKRELEKTKSAHFNGW